MSDHSLDILTWSEHQFATIHGEAAVNSGWWPIIAGLLVALFTAALLLVGALDPFGVLDILE